MADESAVGDSLAACRCELRDLRTNSEYEESLRRAFVDRRTDYIFVTSRREEFQCRSIAYGIERGWLSGRFEGSDIQSQAFACRLTDEGRKHFGIGE